MGTPRRALLLNGQKKFPKKNFLPRWGILFYDGREAEDTGQEVRESLTSYIRENQAYFYRLAYHYVGDRDLAMDLVQDAIVKALQHWESLREPEAVRSWFYRILVRECLSFLRQNRRVIYLPEPPDPGQDSHEGALEDREALRQALEKLSPKVRTVVLLRFYEEMQLSEIAEITGANLSTVKSRLYKGLKKLRECLEG